MNAQPPGPGFPLQAPSVNNCTSDVSFAECQASFGIHDIAHSNLARSNLVEIDADRRIGPRGLAEHPGNANGKRAPLAQLAGDRNRATQELAQFLDDGKAQPAAGVLAGHGVAAGQAHAPLAELLENHLLVFLGNSHARVADAQYQAIALIAAGGDRRPAPPRA